MIPPGDLDFNNTDPFELLKGLLGVCDYHPRAKEAAILDAAWEHINSVDYQVSARWLFYRLLQDGYYSGKNDYKNKYIKLLSRARHAYYQGWRPDTLVDESRNESRHKEGYTCVEEWAKAVTTGKWSCDLDHFHEQTNYTMVTFEAVAMARQFEHYTQGVDLWPFGGMPSIEYKYRIAKRIESCAETYKKPVTVLYFGDYDPAGLTIPETSFNDIQKWCTVNFDFIRCGLNPGDEIKYNIPENPDHPGAYQWEALNDSAAREIITSAVNQYVDQSIIESCRLEGGKAGRLMDEYMAGFYDYYQEATNGQ